MDSRDIAAFFTFQKASELGRCCRCTTRWVRAILYLVIGGGISTTTVGGYTDATARILASDGLNLNERGVRLDEAAMDHKVLEQPVNVLLARRTVSRGRSS